MKQGDLVHVKFVGFNGNLRGDHPEFTKIAFIGRNFKEKRPDYAPPQKEEYWLCRIIIDTKPEHVHRGAFILKPIAECKPFARYEVKPDELYYDDDLDRVTIIRSTYVGQRVIDTKTWTVTSFKDCDPSWPPEINREVEAWYGTFAEMRELAATADERRKQREKAQAEAAARRKLEAEQAERRLEEQRAAWQRECREREERENATRLLEEQGFQVGTVQPRPHAIKAMLRRLKGASDITIKKVVVRKHEVTFVKLDDVHNNKEVYVDGKKVGLYDSWSDMSDTWDGMYNAEAHVTAKSPLTIEERQIFLSNGDEFTICSHQLRVIKKWVFNDSGRWKADKEVIFYALCRLSLAHTKEVRFADVASLKKGNKFGIEYPFQEIGDWVTNGQVWLPKTRPSGGDWHQLPIKAVPEPMWDLFRTGLVGKFQAELLPFYTAVVIKKTVKREPKLTRRQQEVRAVVEGQMWKGEKDCKRVALGKNLIFYVKTVTGKMLYVVDNPGVGAIYIFENLATAKRLASGLMTRTTARMRKYAFIIHSEGWQERLADALQKMSAKAALAA